MSKEKIDISEHSRIAELYRSGLSRDKIAKMYGVSNTVISRILKKCGVQMRDDSHKGRIYTLDEEYFDNICTHNQAYILGLLYADGCNHPPRNTFFIELQERDRKILEQIRDELQSNHPLHFNELNTKNPNWQNTYRLSITNKHISQRLEELGVVQNKSLILEYPQWLPLELTPDFIRGYFDGDGHIEWGQTRFLTLASTETFCNSIKDYLLTKDIVSKVVPAANKGKPTRLLSIYGKKNVYSFLDLIYCNSDLHIQRKYEKYCSIKNEMLARSA